MVRINLKRLLLAFGQFAFQTFGIISIVGRLSGVVKPERIIEWSHFLISSAFFMSLHLFYIFDIPDPEALQLFANNSRQFNNMLYQRSA